MSGRGRSRDEHLAWCKTRALEYLDDGNVKDAVASMMSDMTKHPDCGMHPAIQALGLMAARDNDVAAARRFIVGFN